MASYAPVQNGCSLTAELPAGCAEIPFIDLLTGSADAVGRHQLN
jgi:hypothetical protein